MCSYANAMDFIEEEEEERNNIQGFSTGMKFSYFVKNKNLIQKCNGNVSCQGNFWIFLFCEVE